MLAVQRGGSEDVVSPQGRVDESAFDVVGNAEEVSAPLKSGFSETEILKLDRDIVTEEDFPAYQNLYDDPLLENGVCSSKRRFVGKLLIAFFLLAVAGGGIYWVMFRNGESKIPAPPTPVASTKSNADLPVSPATKLKVGFKGLPSFVHSEWRDVQYTSQHPGWERYVSPEVDFRLFREKGVIKALQGISLSSSGLSEALLAQVLKEAGLNGPLPDGKEVLSNGLLVKNYRVSRGG